jgi:murein DD-endopeptidase MepM/ murein hydrolase activator NlpD
VARKGYTIIVVSPKLNKMKKYRFSLFFPRFLAFSLFLILLGFSYTFFDFISLRGDVIELDRLKRQNTSQRTQLQWFAVQINDLKDNLSSLNAFDRKLRIIANLQSPAPYNRLSGMGGSQGDERPLSSIFNKEHDKLIKEMRSNVLRLKEDAKLQEESLHELKEYIQGKQILLAYTPAIWPTRGWLTSRFGYRVSPFTGLREFHHGIDIGTRMGTPIIAPADGVVTRVGMEGGYGKMVTIDHGYGCTTRYGHISKTMVQVGTRIKRGQMIATVGNTGRSTGPHLHYEVHVNGLPVNPKRYILD